VKSTSSAWPSKTTPWKPARRPITDIAWRSKGATRGGRTYDEALANVREAVELYGEDLRESGSRIPVDPELGDWNGRPRR
jgi:hypothetical protein